MSEKQEQDISQIIDTGLEAIQAGKMTLDDFLKQHPDQTDLIRSEFEVAMWLSSRQNDVAPRAGFINASRKRVVERIQNEASQRGTKHMLFGFLWPPRFAYRTATAIVIVFMLIIASGGVVSASQSMIPGDSLYSVKRFTEQVAYQVTADPAQRVTLSARYADRRLNEAQTLITRGDFTHADAALLEYQQEIKQAVVDLERIPASQSKQKSEMATLLQTNLAMHTDRLEGLKQNVPDTAATTLDQALNVTSSGISNASTVFNEVNHITPTPTATVEPTQEPTSTTVPFTATPIPSHTPKSPGNATPSIAVTPTPESTQGLGLGANDVKPSPTPTPTLKTKETKIPKPTNDNAPGKPVVPPGQKNDPDPPKKDPPKKGNN